MFVLKLIIMIVEPEYKKVSYRELQVKFYSHWANLEKRKSHLQIATTIKVNSITTIQNAFWDKDSKQKVSDEILTKVMRCIGFDGKIEWKDGCRSYYISIYYN